MNNNELGRSLRDGLPMNGAEQVVSAVPVGIPSAEESCRDCDDSGWQEFASGGIWTGENIIVRREPCHCICGDDVRRELAGRAIS